MMGAAFALVFGIQSATAVIVGKYMGQGEFSKAYSSSKELLVYVSFITIFLGFLMFLIRPYVISLFHVNNEHQYLLLMDLLSAFVLYFPVMSLNSVLSNSILKAGGKVYAPLFIDIIGMWLIGVPTALLCVNVLHMDIVSTYALVCLEQTIRLILCLIIFRRKKFMRQMGAPNATT
jgi:Na+-driven multidrug efflux pump